jgi:catechol 2,3-dioxygenase-like lactoylglutathione lyase family enzyme
MADGIQFGQVNLIASNLDATLAFYRLLGLDVPHDAGPPHVSIGFPSGFQLDIDTADFVPDWDSGWRGATGGSTVLGFNVATREEVNELYGRLVDASYVARQPPFDTFFGARYAIVDDPDGNGVGIMSPIDVDRKFWPPARPPAASARAPQ